MISRRDPHPSGDLPLARFLERIRNSFSHDLRTPLGSIVNYAAVLEATQGADTEEVRDLGRRIRGNAQRASRMIQLLANATGLASRPYRAVSTDLLALAQSVLSDVGGHGRVRLASNTLAPLVDLDAEVLGFALRAYTAVEKDARAKSVDEVELKILAEPGHVLVELRSGVEPRSGADPRGGTQPVATPANPSADPVLDLPNFLRHNGGVDRLETALGLRLAQDLVISLGGDLQVWGRPGVRSGLRLRFPTAA